MSLECEATQVSEPSLRRLSMLCACQSGAHQSYKAQVVWQIGRDLAETRCSLTSWVSGPKRQSCSLLRSPH